MIINEEGTYTLRYTATDDCGKTTTVDRELKVKEVAKVYGAEWSGSDSSAWTRTDNATLFANPSPAVNNGTGSSPFDNIYPWSDMQIVEDAEAGTLVSIPKFYYKWTVGENTVKLQITSEETDGFSTSPAHADRGDGVGERDIVYVGRYHCASDDYKSKRNALPKGSLHLSDYITNIHALGSTIFQYDYAMYWTIRMLYLVEFADWDSQKVIGYGCSANRALFNMGATDQMQYHTGTDAVSRDTYGSVQYRHIEGLWDNVYDFVDGIGCAKSQFNNGYDYFMWKTPNINGTNPNFGVGTVMNGSGIPTKFSVANNSNADEWYHFAIVCTESVASSSYDVRTCDLNRVDKADVELGELQSGGAYFNQQYQGLFHINGSLAKNSQANSSQGSRLMKLPSA